MIPYENDLIRYFATRNAIVKKERKKKAWLKEYGLNSIDAKREYIRKL